MGAGRSNGDTCSNLGEKVYGFAWKAEHTLFVRMEWRGRFYLDQSHVVVPDWMRGAMGLED